MLIIYELKTGYELPLKVCSTLKEVHKYIGGNYIRLTMSIKGKKRIKYKGFGVERVVE